MTKRQTTAGASMKKVLMLGPVPPPFGGIASVMETIIHSSLAKDYFFEVFERKHHIPEEWAGLIKRNIFRLKNFIKLYQRLIKSRYDFIHMHVPFGSTFQGTVIFMFIARLTATKILLHIHGTDWDTFYTRAPQSLKLLYQIGLRMPQLIVVLYETWRAKIKGLNPNAHVETLANCLEDVQAPMLTLVQEARSKLGVDADDFIFLTVGFVGWRKGHLDILNAIPQVAAFNDRVRFVFLGGEEYPHESDAVISRIKNENLGRWVIVTKEVERSEVPAYLACADVFLLPSRREGMPIAILEAMRAGLPVVTTRVGAIPEMIENGKSGLLIEPGSPAQIVCVLIKLLENDKLRLELARGARDAFAHKFEVNAVINQLASLYQMTCGDF